MIKHVFLTGMLAAATVASAASSQSFLFKLDLDVNPISATQFEVIEARGAGAMDIWCAAAEYAEDELRVPSNGRLYIDVPRGPAKTVSGRKGVVFTTQGAGGGGQVVSVSVRRSGDSLPVFHARQFCRNNILEPDDRY